MDWSLLPNEREEKIANPAESRESSNRGPEIFKVSLESLFSRLRYL